MPIDLLYLLWLQDIRNATGGIFDEFFNGPGKLTVEIMPFPLRECVFFTAYRGSFRPALIHSRNSAAAVNSTSPEELIAVSQES